MLAFGVAAAFAIALIAGALFFQARRIKERHRRFVSGAAPAGREGERIFEAARALYHGTRFQDGTALLVPAWREACLCDLFCTADALFVQREAQGALLAIGLREVDEAALHRADAPLAGKELPMLRLRWSRGGEKLETDLSLRGGMASLEALRREIHLRQGNIAAQLQTFLERQP